MPRDAMFAANRATKDTYAAGTELKMEGSYSAAHGRVLSSGPNSRKDLTLALSDK